MTARTTAGGNIATAWARNLAGYSASWARKGPRHSRRAPRFREEECRPKDGVRNLGSFAPCECCAVHTLPRICLVFLSPISTRRRRRLVSVPPGPAIALGLRESYRKMPNKIAGFDPPLEAKEADTDAYLLHMERISQRRRILSEAIREMRRFSTRAEIAKTLRDAADMLASPRR
jgi:hypothetical protein